MDKKTAIKKVQNDEAEFITENHVGKDAWEQIYECEGYVIKICAYGNSRWIMDDEEFVEVEPKSIN